VHVFRARARLRELLCAQHDEAAHEAGADAQAA
jgi:hypothetical protein